MKREYKIAVLGGDGIGPEVVEQGVRVLEKAAKLNGFGINLTSFPYGADHFIKEGQLVRPNKSELYRPEGELVPKSFIEDMQSFDSMLLGAIGDERVERGVIERAIIGGLRWSPELDLYVNLRPIKLYSAELSPIKGAKKEDIDFVIVRENTEGAYTRPGGFRYRGTPEEEAHREIFATRRGTERIIKYAFEYARNNNHNKVSLVDKANVMNKDVGELWRTVFNEVKVKYPGIDTDEWYVDNFAQQIIKDCKDLDVAVMENLFGDIISDEAAMVVGGVGIGASGNIHPGKFSMFESIHGSSPKYKGKNVANPLATILAVKMMLEHLNQYEAAQHIDDSIQSLFDDNTFTDVSARSGRSTNGIADLVLERMS